jgi:hypothetical protein
MLQHDECNFITGVYHPSCYTSVGNAFVGGIASLQHPINRMAEPIRMSGGEISSAIVDDYTETLGGCCYGWYDIFSLNSNPSCNVDV